MIGDNDDTLAALERGKNMTFNAKHRVGLLGLAIGDHDDTLAALKRER